MEFRKDHLFVYDVDSVARGPVQNAHVLWRVVVDVLDDHRDGLGLFVDAIGHASVRAFVEKVFVESLSDSLAYHLTRENRIMLCKKSSGFGDELHVDAREEISHSVLDVLCHARSHRAIVFYVGEHSASYVYDADVVTRVFGDVVRFPRELESLPVRVRISAAGSHVERNADDGDSDGLGVRQQRFYFRFVRPVFV